MATAIWLSQLESLAFVPEKTRYCAKDYAIKAAAAAFSRRETPGERAAERLLLELLQSRRPFEPKVMWHTFPDIH